MTNRRPFRFGVMAANARSAVEWRETARKAEGLGYSTLVMPDHFAGQQCLPDELLGQTFYQPGAFGFEKDIAKRLQWWEERRKPRDPPPG